MKVSYVIILIGFVLLLLNRKKMEKFWLATQYGIPMSKKRLLRDFNINKVHHDDKWVRDPSHPI